ncbi:Os06g0613101, partial [Oryza sativa Japonica Group]
VEVDGVELVLEALQWLQEEVPVGARRREAQRVVETERCRLGEACGAAERRVVVVFAAAGGGGFPAADLSLGAGEVGRGGGCHEASRPGGELQGHRAGEAVQPGDGVEPRGRPRPADAERVGDGHARPVERLERHVAALKPAGGGVDGAGAGGGVVGPESGVHARVAPGDGGLLHR